MLNKNLFFTCSRWYKKKRTTVEKILLLTIFFAIFIVIGLSVTLAAVISGYQLAQQRKHFLLNGKESVIMFCLWLLWELLWWKILWEVLFDGVLFGKFLNPERFEWNNEGLWVIQNFKIELEIRIERRNLCAKGIFCWH